MIEPDIMAEVYFYPTEQGGRKGPTPDTFFGCIFVYKNKNYDCRLLLDGIGSIYPGQRVIVPIVFLYSDILKLLKEGDTFYLWDGGNKAEGKVLKICNHLSSNEEATQKVKNK